MPPINTKDRYHFLHLQTTDTQKYRKLIYSIVVGIQYSSNKTQVSIIKTVYVNSSDTVCTGGDPITPFHISFTIGEYQPSLVYLHITSTE